MCMKEIKSHMWRLAHVHIKCIWAAKGIFFQTCTFSKHASPMSENITSNYLS